MSLSSCSQSAEPATGETMFQGLENYPAGVYRLDSREWAYTDLQNNRQYRMLFVDKGSMSPLVVHAQRQTIEKIYKYMLSEKDLSCPITDDEQRCSIDVTQSSSDKYYTLKPSSSNEEQPQSWMVKIWTSTKNSISTIKEVAASTIDKSLNWVVVGACGKSIVSTPSNVTFLHCELHANGDEKNSGQQPVQKPVSLEECLAHSSGFEDPFTRLATENLQQYEPNFVFSPKDTGSYYYTIDTSEGNKQVSLIATPPTKGQNKFVLNEYERFLIAEYGLNTSQRRTLLSYGIDFNKMKENNEPLTPNHVFKCNIAMLDINKHQAEDLLRNIIDDLCPVWENNNQFVWADLEIPLSSGRIPMRTIRKMKNIDISKVREFLQLIQGYNEQFKKPKKTLKRLEKQIKTRTSGKQYGLTPEESATLDRFKRICAAKEETDLPTADRQLFNQFNVIKSGRNMMMATKNFLDKITAILRADLIDYLPEQDVAMLMSLLLPTREERFRAFTGRRIIHTPIQGFHTMGAQGDKDPCRDLFELEHLWDRLENKCKTEESYYELVAHVLSKKAMYRVEVKDGQKPKYSLGFIFPGMQHDGNKTFYYVQQFDDDKAGMFRFIAKPLGDTNLPLLVINRSTASNGNADSGTLSVLADMHVLCPDSLSDDPGTSLLSATATNTQSVTSLSSTTRDVSAGQNEKIAELLQQLEDALAALGKVAPDEDKEVQQNVEAFVLAIQKYVIDNVKEIVDTSAGDEKNQNIREPLCKFLKQNKKLSKLAAPPMLATMKFSSKNKENNVVNRGDRLQTADCNVQILLQRSIQSTALTSVSSSSQDHRKGQDDIKIGKSKMSISSHGEVQAMKPPKIKEHVVDDQEAIAVELKEAAQKIVCSQSFVAVKEKNYINQRSLAIWAVYVIAAAACETDAVARNTFIKEAIPLFKTYLERKKEDDRLHIIDDLEQLLKSDEHLQLLKKLQTLQERFKERKEDRVQGDIVVIGHSLGGALAQHQCMHLLNAGRVPLPGRALKIFAFDAPAVRSSENDQLSTFLGKHGKMLEKNNITIQLRFQFEYGDSVAGSGGRHLGAFKSPSHEDCSKYIWTGIVCKPMENCNDLEMLSCTHGRRFLLAQGRKPGQSNSSGSTGTPSAAVDYEYCTISSEDMLAFDDTWIGGDKNEKMGVYHTWAKNKIIKENARDGAGLVVLGAKKCVSLIGSIAGLFSKSIENSIHIGQGTQPQGARFDDVITAYYQ